MSKLGIIARAGTTLAAVAVLAGGVTFAALSDTATLTNNTISSATASLLVDGPDAGAVATESEAGFSFTDLVPGGGFSDPQAFTLENEGTSDLDVTVFATVGTMSGVLDKTKVNVMFTNTTPGGGGETETYTLAQLEAVFNNVPGASDTDFLPMDDTSTASTDEGLNTFTIEVELADGAVTSGSASITGFNLVFTGTAVVPPAS